MICIYYINKCGRIIDEIFFKSNKEFHASLSRYRDKKYIRIDYTYFGHPPIFYPDFFLENLGLQNILYI